MVSGDTGPVHIAAAVGTPIVGIFGPTRPSRNGPWLPDDVTVSRADVCQCHHLRQCRARSDVPARHRRRRSARRRSTGGWRRKPTMSERDGHGAARALSRFRGFRLRRARAVAGAADRADSGGGALVAGVGEAIRIWAAGHLHKSREVTASGPYRWFAHPLYLGSSVMGGGLAIASGSVSWRCVIAAYLSVALTVAARSEEAFLRGRSASLRSVSARSGGRRAAIQLGAGEGQPRVPRAHRFSAGGRVARAQGRP